MTVYLPKFRMINCERCFGTGRIPVRGLVLFGNILRRAELSVRQNLVENGRYRNLRQRDAHESRIENLQIDLEPRERQCTMCEGVKRFDQVLNRKEHWVNIDKWREGDRDGIAFVEAEARKNAFLMPAFDRESQRIFRDIDTTLRRYGLGELPLPPAHDALAPLRNAS